VLSGAAERCGDTCTSLTQPIRDCVAQVQVSRSIAGRIETSNKQACICSLVISIRRNQHRLLDHRTFSGQESCL